MRFLMTLVLSLLVLAAPIGARAGIPAPGNSTLDPVLVTSPDGTVIYHVTVRDFANNTVPGSQVTLDFSTCPNVTFCATACTNCTVNPLSRTLSAFTGASGVATFDVRSGGTCAQGSPAGMRIYADGVLLAQQAVAPFDQDGDLVVGPADVAIVTARMGSADATADFDHSGVVDAADAAFVTAHTGARCPGPVPTLAPTWGRLKSIYR